MRGMDFDSASGRSASEPFTPMINVVFLLLIFFLMTAEIAPPAPFETAPPVAPGGADPGGTATLHLSATGDAAFVDLRGAAAIGAAAAAGGALRIRADRRLDAARLAALLSRLAAAGAGPVEIVTAPR